MLRSHTPQKKTLTDENPYAKPTRKTHSQNSLAKPTCKTHMQNPHAKPTCKTHMQNPHAKPTCKTHMQNPRKTHMQNPHAKPTQNPHAKPTQNPHAKPIQMKTRTQNSYRRKPHTNEIFVEKIHENENNEKIFWTQVAVFLGRRSGWWSTLLSRTLDN
jgi:hypothetical protein